MTDATATPDVLSYILTVSERKPGRSGVRLKTETFAGAGSTWRAAEAYSGVVSGMIAEGWKRVAPAAEGEDMFVCVFGRGRDRRTVVVRPATPAERALYADGRLDELKRWAS